MSGPLSPIFRERPGIRWRSGWSILLIVDGTVRLTPEDLDLMRTVSDTGKPWVLVVSKKDLARNASSLGVIGAKAPHAVAVSSATGEGLDDLAAAVEYLFPRGSDASYGQMLTNQRQAEAAGRAREAVGRAREALEAGITPDALLTDVEEALSALGELTGQSVREDITDRIFSRFCVGK